MPAINPEDVVNYSRRCLGQVEIHSGPDYPIVVFGPAILVLVDPGL